MLWRFLEIHLASHATSFLDETVEDAEFIGDFKIAYISIFWNRVPLLLLGLLLVGCVVCSDFIFLCFYAAIFVHFLAVMDCLGDSAYGSPVKYLLDHEV